MIRFLVFSDLHYDDIIDGDKRIEELISKAKEEQVDFIVSLGDLCFPTEENRSVLEKLESANIPIHYAIGNHDTEKCPIEETLLFLSKDKSYGSFEYGEYKFIILDSCFWRNERGEDRHFPNKKRERGIYPVIPSEQTEWLKGELSSDKKIVIFSHMSIVNEFVNRGICNKQELLDLFAGKKVILCMNGHNHGDDLKIIENIPFYTLNSSSFFCWWGGNPPGSEVREFPYKDALHVVVELEEKEIRIKGMESEYSEDTPEAVGLKDYRWKGVSIEPRTSAYVLKLVEK